MADSTKNDKVMMMAMADHHQMSVDSTLKTTNTEMEGGGGQDDHEEEEVDDVDEERIEDLAIYRLDYEEDNQKCLDDAAAAAAAAAATAVAYYDEDGCMAISSLQPRAAGGEILKPGDHCYMWCTLYQHHAIVLEIFPAVAAAASAAATTTSTTKTVDTIDTADAIPEKTPEQDKNSNCDDYDAYKEQETQPGLGAGGSILIAEFTNVALQEDLVGLAVANNNNNNKHNNNSITASLLASASTAAGATSGGGVQGGFRIILEMDPHVKWHKVKYQANPVECLTWRPGTCSSATCLPTRDILMRVHFLYEWGHALIPDYHLVFSNCETVAVWCVTGQWMTLQGDGALSMLGTATAAAAAAAVTTMAMAPVGVALAATSGGLALFRSMRLQKQCNDTAAMLNHQYEWYSLGRTPTTFSFQPTA